MFTSNGKKPEHAKMPEHAETINIIRNNCEKP